MNKGTDQNIMTQLGITSNEYNLVTVLYYVSESKLVGLLLLLADNSPLDSLYCVGSALQFAAQKVLSFKMAGKNYAQLGHCFDVQRGREEQGWSIHHAILIGCGTWFQ